MKLKFPPIKSVIRIILLAFVVASVSFLFAKEYMRSEGDIHIASTPPPTAAIETTPAEPNRVSAYYFRSNFRCASCKKIEEYSRAAIEGGFAQELKNGKLEFDVINVEEPANRHFIQDYSLITKSLVLVLKDGDKQVRFKNLDQVWKLLGSREKFIAYVQDEVKNFLREIKR